VDGASCQTVRRNEVMEPMRCIESLNNDKGGVLRRKASCMVNL